MDCLDRIMESVRTTIRSGYYSVEKLMQIERRSFTERIHTCSVNPVIAELKPASPSAGQMLKQKRIEDIVCLYKAAGVVGISVLTEPVHFGGSLEHLKLASATGLPTLMKDFVIHPVQLEAGAACGSSAVLLILSLFRRGYAPLNVHQMIALAHQKGLEVVLEVNSPEEFKLAQKTKTDMIGINNRDLATLKVDLDTTKHILSQAPKDRLVWGMSGIESAEDLRRLKQAGADAFLVGTSLMQASDPAGKLTELINA